MKAFSYSLAAVCLIALGARAWLVFDPSWDALSYHLPFAARLVGMCDVACFEMRPHLEEFYRAFPRLLNFIQGAFWMITRRPEAPNFVSFLSLLVAIYYIHRDWEIPLDVATLGLCAIPVVQIFATSSYVDMAANTAAFIGAMKILKLGLNEDCPTIGDFLWFVPSVVVLGNSKTQMMPVALVLASAYFIILAWRHGLHSRHLIVAAATVTALSATGIWNLFIFGNPVYPVRLSFGSFSLHGTIAAQASNSVPVYADHFPQPLRWLLSVLEFRAYDNRYTPWTLGQGDVHQTEYSFRMGGYFVAYVALCIMTLAILVPRMERRKRRVLIIYAVFLTIGVAMLPGSHELRYYMFWMMVLVSIAMWLIFDQSHDLHQSGRLAILAMFTSVIMITGGRYLDFTGPDNSTLRQGLGINAVVNGLNDDSVICIEAENRAFFYSSVFYPGTHHKTVQGVRASGCDTIIH